MSNEQDTRHPDEIDLVDVGLSLYRRRWLMATVAAAVIAIGVLAVVLRAPSYAYSTTIEIGTQVTEGNVRPIEPAEAVVVKLEDSYIPEVRRRLRESNGRGSSPSLAIEVRNPSNSELIVLESEGTSAHEDSYLEAHRRVVGLVIEDHQRISEVVRSELERELEQAKLELEELEDPATLASKVEPVVVQLTEAQLELESLKDPKVYRVPRKALENEIAEQRDELGRLQDRAGVLKQRRGQLKERRTLVEAEIADIRDYIERSRQQRLKAADEAGEGSRAMTLLLIDAEIQRNSQRLGELRTELQVDIPNELAELQAAIAENQRLQALQKEKIAAAESELEKLIAQQERDQRRQQPRVAELEGRLQKIKNDHQRAIAAQRTAVDELQVRLENLRRTRAVRPPRRSLTPAEMGALPLLAVTIVLGLFLAVVSAFVANFLDAVRERARTET